MAKTIDEAGVYGDKSPILSDFTYNTQTITAQIQNKKDYIV